MSTSLGAEVKKAAARVLVQIAVASGRPPQRRALGALVQVLQMHRPANDAAAQVMQPYVRSLLLQALQVPTPPL
eukprot:15063338-Heterocapsa_arctica.AAC.1